MRTKEQTTAQDRSAADSASGQFDWLPDAWFCGTPNQRCVYCGKPVIFTPTCLSIESCTCGAVLSKTDFSLRGKPASRIGATGNISAG